MELELEFRVYVFPEGLDSSWQWYTACLPTPERCVVFEVVVERRAKIDEEFARWAAAPERYFLSLTGTTPRTGFEGPQGGLFPEASPGEGQAQAVRKSTDFPQRVCRTLGVATSHKGEHTREKRVLSLGGLFCGASAPSLPPWVVSFGVFLSRYWNCHVVTTL